MAFFSRTLLANFSGFLINLRKEKCILTNFREEIVHKSLIFFFFLLHKSEKEEDPPN